MQSLRKNNAREKMKKYVLIALLLLTACDSGAQAVPSAVAQTPMPTPTVTVTVTPAPIIQSVPVSIVSTSQCEKTTGVGVFSYRIVNFSNGDKFVKCGVKFTGSTSFLVTSSDYLAANEPVTCTVDQLLSSGSPTESVFDGRNFVTYNKVRASMLAYTDSFLESECVSH